MCVQVPGHAGAEYSMAPPAANGQVYGQYAHVAAQQQQQAQPQLAGVAAPFPQMSGQAYGYGHLQQPAPQVCPEAGRLLAFCACFCRASASAAPASSSGRFGGRTCQSGWAQALTAAVLLRLCSR